MMAFDAEGNSGMEMQIYTLIVIERPNTRPIGNGRKTFIDNRLTNLVGKWLCKYEGSSRDSVFFVSGLFANL